jgi:hypothetical protein
MDPFLIRRFNFRVQVLYHPLLPIPPLEYYYEI